MAKITVRDGYHILGWVDPQTGKYRRQSLGPVGAISETDLKACLHVKQFELSTGARLLNVHRRPAPTLTEFAQDYLLWHKAEYPASHYRIEQIILQHILPTFGTMPLNLITVEAAEKWKTKRRFAVRGASVEKELRVFKALINRAVALKIITDNPISIVNPPQNNDSKPHQFYEAEHLEKLYEASNRGAVWSFMANTGVRRGEALILRWDWVGKTDLKILSTEEERTKSGKWRQVPLSVGARRALQAIPQVGEHIMPQMQPESLSRAFALDATAAGIGGSLHTLRHTYISHLVRNGVPLRTVQVYAGHAHYTTTEKYAYLQPGLAPKAVLKLAL